MLRHQSQLLSVDAQHLAVLPHLMIVLVDPSVVQAALGYLRRFRKHARASMQAQQQDVIRWAKASAFVLLRAEDPPTSEEARESFVEPLASFWSWFQSWRRHRFLVGPEVHPH